MQTFQTILATDLEVWTTGFGEFVQRLVSNRARLIIGLLLAIAALGLVSQKTNLLVGLLAGLGTFFLVWQVFNAFANENTPLFIGKNDLGTMWSMATSSTFAALFFIAGLLAGFGTFYSIWTQRSKSAGSTPLSLIFAAFAGIGAWWCVMFLYYVLESQLSSVT